METTLFAQEHGIEVSACFSNERTEMIRFGSSLEPFSKMRILITNGGVEQIRDMLTWILKEREKTGRTNIRYPIPANDVDMAGVFPMEDGDLHPSTMKQEIRDAR